jgi:hypothetical protein
LVSVRAMLFEMLTGKPPHVAPTYEAVLIAICTHDTVDVRTQAPEVPASVAALVERALRRDREQRFQSAREFLTAITALEGAFAQDGSAWATPSNAKPAARAVRKRYGTLVAGIIASLAGFTLTAYFVVRHSDSTAASQEARRPPPSAATSAVVAGAASAPVVLPVSSATSVAPTLPARVPAPSNPRRAPPAPAAKPSSHVASGLKLSTKEP